MNRRLFITRTTTFIATTCLVAHIPLEWTPSVIRRSGALEMLVRAYRAHMRGLRSSQHPTQCFVAPAVQDDIYDEMRRLDWLPYGGIDTQGDYVWFKAMKLYSDRQLAWGEVRFV